MKHIRIIYRVEHPVSGIGPYRHDHINPMHCDLQRLMGQEHSKDMGESNDDHPGAYNDFDMDLQENDIFGFNSLEDLTTWFDTWLDILFEMGYVVRSYKVADNFVADSISGLQVVFKKQFAEFEFNVLP